VITNYSTHHDTVANMYSTPPPLKVRKKGIEKIKLTHVNIVRYKIQLNGSLIATCLEDRLLLQHLKNSENTKITAKRRKKKV
jgi:hypothetical protein